MTDLISTNTLEDTITALFNNVATMIVNAVLTMRWPVLTISILLNLAVAKPAYLQVRRDVIEWAVNQPETDKFMADKAQSDDIAAMKLEAGTAPLPVKSKK